MRPLPSAGNGSCGARRAVTSTGGRARPPDRRDPGLVVRHPELPPAELDEGDDDEDHDPSSPANGFEGGPEHPPGYAPSKGRFSPVERPVQPLELRVVEHDQAAAVARDPDLLLRRLVGDADRGGIRADGLEHGHVGGPDLAHRRGAVVHGIDRPAIARDRHRPRLARGAHRREHGSGRAVELADRSARVVGDIEVFRVRADHEMPRTAARLGERGDGLGGEIDGDDAPGTHERDIRRGGVG